MDFFLSVQEEMMLKNKLFMNILLMLIAAAIAVIPLVIIRDSKFSGADGAAADMIREESPAYEPWFEPLWTPPGNEIESLLFALQAAAGSGIVCLVIGYYIGRKQERNKNVHDR